VSSVDWRLEPDSEREILLPWLDGETDLLTRLAVLEFLADLLRRPLRPALEDEDSGVFSIARVPGTSVGVVWTLDLEERQVTLAFIGPTGSV
jgi:hypothetical protein